jgi:Zn-dependent protease with chaperone function
MHPYDQAARARMEAIPLLPQVTSWVSGAVSERVILQEHLSSGLRVTPRQYPRLYRRFVGLASVLDVPRLPQLFVVSGSSPNAYAMGEVDYSVGITGAALDVLTDGEVDFLLAHELGHIKCDHMRWRSVAQALVVLGAGGLTLLVQNSGGGLAGTLITVGGSAALLAAAIAIMEWSRKAEFSADRAGLLGCQDLEAAQSTLSKLTVGTLNYPEPIDRSEVLLQADALEEAIQESVAARMIHYGRMLSQTHPYLPLRVRDIGLWHSVGEFGRIVDGAGRVPPLASGVGPSAPDRAPTAVAPLPPPPPPSPPPPPPPPPLPPRTR